MENCKLYIVTFVITALWDVVLRIMVENYDKLPEIVKLDFMEYLIPYFQKHTLLAAALIAGFIGATTQYIIVMIQSFPKNLSNIQTILQFLVLSFVISALYGFIMKFSNLYPHLEETYYKDLGTVRSMYHDGISGLIVQITIFGLMMVNKNII
tara:strand:+ start:41 stop:499 length:459 start_codon:yes stop_codon:yes gene_type:complete